MPGHVLDKVALVYSDDYTIRLGGLEKLHPFDIRKYERIVKRLDTEGLVGADEYFAPAEVDDSTMMRVHSRDYLSTLDDGRAIATYLEAPVLRVLPTPMLVNNVVRSFRVATGGTILAARFALTHGIGINLAGGYHHAKPNTGEGFNIFNDMAVAIRVLQEDGSIQKALVVDLDVHQGNGTAACFARDESVFTFSIHQSDLYPWPTGRESDLDIGLHAPVNDERYLAVLSEHWPAVLDHTQPDIVFFQAGCDVLADDPLGGFAMTHDGVVLRDAMIIDGCVKRGIPVVMLLGGGYSKDAWFAQYRSIARTLEAHGGRSPKPVRKPSKMVRR